MRKTLLLLSVALLTATAGCNLGGQSNTGASGNVSGPQLNNATADAVESAGSYTFHRDTLIVTENGRETTVNTTTRVDFESEQGLREASQNISGRTLTPNVTQSVYTTGETTYQRQETLGNVTYDVQQGSGSIDPVNVTAFSRNYTAFTTAFEFEANGTATVEGASTTRYSSVNLTDGSTLTGNPNATVVNASATLYVDDEGALRRAVIDYGIRVDGSTTRVQVTDTFSEFGSTTVTEPDWVEDARSANTSS